MRILKTGLMFFCLLSFSMVLISAAGADVFTNTSQIVNLYGSSTTAVIGSWSQITPSGELKPYSIPAGKAVVIRQVTVKSDPTAFNSYLAIPPYYSMPFNAGSESIFGFAVSNNGFQAKLLDSQGNPWPLQGKFEVYLQGYVIQLFASLEYINLLLGNSQDGSAQVLAMARALPEYGRP